MISSLISRITMNRQRAAINSALLSFDSDLPTNTISLGYSTSAAKHYDLPLDYFFDHETYIYAVLPQKSRTAHCSS